MSRALLFCFCVLGGCELFAGRQVRVQCRVNADCGPSNLCFFHTCVEAEGVPKAGILAELLPPAPLDRPPQILELRTEARTTLRWSDPIEWRGSVVKEDQVSYSIAGEFLIRQRKAYVRPIAASDQFAIFLNEGDYDVIFTPSENARPPLSLVWQVESGVAFRADYPRDSSLLRFRGRLAANKLDPLVSPIAGASVYATLDGSGLPSTTTTSDRDGIFVFAFAPIQGNFTLHVGPSDINPFVPRLDLSQPAPQAEDLGTIEVGEVGSVLFVEGRVLGAPTDTPLPGTIVTAEATVGRGIYRTAATTRAAGDFTLTLARTSQALDYQLRVIPTDSSGFAASTLVYRAPNEGTAPELRITVSERVHKLVSVLDPSGAPMKNVHLTATPRDQERFATVRGGTGTDGKVALALDAAAYDLAITPPPGTRFSRAYAETDGGDDTPLTLSLRRGATVCGEITFSPTGVLTSFEGGGISFFTLEGEKRVEIGEALVDDDDHFCVVLPSE